MKCLETRRKQGLKWRRYRDDDGLTHTTYEIPTQVWNAMAKRARARLEAYERGVAQRRVQAKALVLLQDGWKPEAVAHELKISVRVVQKLRKQLT